MNLVLMVEAPRHLYSGPIWFWKNKNHYGGNVNVKSTLKKSVDPIPRCFDEAGSNNLTPYAEDHKVLPIDSHTFQKGGSEMITRRDFTKLSVAVAALAATNVELKADSQTSTKTGAEVTGPRRVGRRNHGQYWGSSNDHIDLLSGNLCVTERLIAPTSRRLQSALVISYNSQILQKRGSSTETMGFDSGSGFGWRLQFASIHPTNNTDDLPAGYKLTDGTGADYVLTEANGKWLSLSTEYQTWDPGERTLSLANGSKFFFGCVSGSGEADAGSFYPTRLSCANGNIIEVTYLPGKGEKAPNTSSRISSITDANSFFSEDTVPNYTFVYSDDAIPHVVAINCATTPSSSYTFSYSKQVIKSPFANTDFEQKEVLMLSSVTSKEGRKRGFVYNEFGEMTNLLMPGGGQVSWNYRDFSFADGSSIREVKSRTLASSEQDNYSRSAEFVRDESDGSLLTHSTMEVVADSGLRRTVYAFISDPSSHDNGLISSINDYSGSTLHESQVFSWRRTSSGMPYPSGHIRTIDPNSSNSVVSSTRTLRDQFGNVTEVRETGSADPNGSARVVRHSYLSTEDYTSRHILNKRIRTAVQQGTEEITTSEHLYDTTPLGSAEGATHHDSTNFSASHVLRGNPTESVVHGVYTKHHYDVLGNRIYSEDSKGSSSQFVYSGSSNHARVISHIPNGRTEMASTLDYSGGRVSKLTSPTGISQFDYDSLGVLQSGSTAGLTTSVSRSESPSAVTVTQGEKWMRKTQDSLGRTIKIEHGNSSGTLVSHERQYAAVGRPHAGSIVSVSLPHAPSESPMWLNRSYDPMGRLVSLTPTAHAKPITLEYRGNAQTISDGTGRWKRVHRDSRGRIIKVVLPDPKGGSDQETHYLYNALGALCQVVMPRQKGTQQRTFQHDDNGRLIARRHAESGDQKLTYNADGTLASKVDAKGQRESFLRDAFKRVTSREYFDAKNELQVNESVTYYYDKNPFDSGFTENGNGRLVAVRWGDQNTAPGMFTEMYSYTETGAESRKKLIIQRGDLSSALELRNVYDDHGRLEASHYPAGGPILHYTYDDNGRLISVSSEEYDVVKNVEYTPTGKLAQFDVLATQNQHYMTETHEYDERSRLVRIEAKPAGDSAAAALQIPQIDLEYRYAEDDGRVAQEADRISGTAVSYKYDNQGRLASALASDLSWGLEFGYDGFGNRTEQRVSHGTAFAHEAKHDPATNWMMNSEIAYDANGNLLSLPYMRFQYDVRNRLTSCHYMSGEEKYSYDHKNRRVWRSKADGSEYINFYDQKGKRIATYSLTQTKEAGLQLTSKDTYIYFGKRMVRSQGEAVVLDRIDSVRAWSNETAARKTNYFPFGEPIRETSGDKPAFGGYNSDASGLDYAFHRYYAASIGRFTTPDRYENSAKRTDPNSWNRYTFVGNDPVNSTDPSGDNSIFQTGHTYQVPGGNGAVVTVTGEGTGTETFPDGTQATVTIADWGSAVSATEVVAVPGTTDTANITITATPSSGLSLSDALADLGAGAGGVATVISGLVGAATIDATAGTVAVGAIEIEAATLAFIGGPLTIAIGVGLIVLALAAYEIQSSSNGGGH